MHPFIGSTPTSAGCELSSPNTSSSRGSGGPNDTETDNTPGASDAPLALAPGVRVLWRAATVTQWELAGRSVIVDGADSATIAALLGARPDSSPGPGRRRAHGAGWAGSDGARDERIRGTRDAEVRSVRAQLHRAGFLWRGSDGIGSSAPRPHGRAARMPERLLADLQALASRFGDDAAQVMQARRSRSIQVIGADRTAATIAVLLAAAGIGRLELAGLGAARLEHAMPGGVSPADEGRRWSEATADAIRRAAPEAEIAVAPTAAAPDLAIVASPRPMADELRDELHAGAQPHLCVGVDGGHAVIGPLVLPGWSSCVRCLELHRRDRDPAWWALAAQLATAPRRTPPSDVALCTIVAGFAVSQALSLLDGESPTTIDATIEITLPDWRMRRRTRLPHPECGCASR